MVGDTVPATSWSSSWIFSLVLFWAEVSRNTIGVIWSNCCDAALRSSRSRSRELTASCRTFPGIIFSSNQGFIIMDDNRMLGEPRLQPFLLQYHALLAVFFFTSRIRNFPIFFIFRKILIFWTFSENNKCKILDKQAKNVQKYHPKQWFYLDFVY